MYAGSRDPLGTGQRETCWKRWVPHAQGSTATGTLQLGGLRWCNSIQEVGEQSQKSLPKALLLLRELRFPPRQDRFPQHVKSGRRDSRTPPRSL